MKRSSNLAVLCLSLSCASVTSADGLTLSLERVGSAPGHFHQRMPVGDTDDDGRLELGLAQNIDGQWAYAIHEHVGDFQFIQVQRGPYSIPFALGFDSDGDGRRELVGQVGGLLSVYEAQ